MPSYLPSSVPSQVPSITPTTSPTASLAAIPTTSPTASPFACLKNTDCPRPEWDSCTDGICVRIPASFDAQYLEQQLLHINT